MLPAEVGYNQVKYIEESTDEEDRTIAGQFPGTLVIESLPELVGHIGGIKF